MDETKTTAPTLWQMALVFLKVGATGFGGAMPMLAMIQGEVVERRRWVSREEFDEAVMIGQILPGPIAVDAVEHMGHKLHGLPGAVAAWFFFILPSFLLMLGLTLLYLNFGQQPQLSGALKGLGGGVVAVVAAAAYRMGKPLARDYRALALMAGAMLGLLLLQANVVLIVILAGLVGLVLYRAQPMPLPGDKRPVRKGGGR